MPRFQRELKIGTKRHRGVSRNADLKTIIGLPCGKGKAVVTCTRLYRKWPKDDWRFRVKLEDGLTLRENRMTWVVGTGVMTGYAFGLSDIRVTFPANNTTRDCLQKIHPVGPFLAAGFAGSVRIGFKMIENLSRLLYVPQDEPTAWDPGEVAEYWPEDARKVFAAQPLEERVGGSEIMLLGVHPSAHNGNPGWGRAEVYTFRSPDFRPVKAKPHELLAIGCGVAVPEFQSALREVSENNDRRMLMMQGEQGRIGGMGTMLAIELTRLLQKHQPEGISSHLHLCYVLRGRTVIRTNDHQRDGRWSAWNLGPETEAVEDANFKMPGIASSYQEFVELLNANGQTAVGAIA